MKEDFDLIVLGGGSGGLAAAKRAAKHGAKVAIVEGDRIGGTCVIRGCVPKKLLVYASKHFENIKSFRSYGIQLKDISFNSNILLDNVRKEVDRLNDLHIRFLNDLGIQIFKGWGSFIDSNTIAISKRNEGKEDLIIEGKYILIAVGGLPLRPSIPGSNLGWVSDDIFELTKFPEKVVIVGGGFIACEFACILNNLGVKVTLLVRGEYILKGFDKELSDSLLTQMKKIGIKIFFNSTPTSISKIGEDLKIKINSNLLKTIDCGGVLFATGRKPFLEGLNLIDVGISCDLQRVKVDENNKTNITNIFAIGDVTDRVNLTPVAIEEGRIFADRIFADIDRQIDYKLIPSAVFSQPEIASIGLTEETAVEEYGKENVKVYKTSFRPMSQALPKKESICFLKIISKLKDNKILGCHMLGEDSAEIIQMASISIGMGATKSDFDRTMALHPTIAEEFVTMS